MTVALARARVLVLAAVVAPADALPRAGMLAQVAVAVPVHKIQVPVLGVEIIAMELALVPVGLALVVRVLIQYMMYIDFRRQND
jgi:hypothetical protein